MLNLKALNHKELYESFYRVSEQPGLANFSPAYVRLPIYLYSDMQTIVQNNFFLIDKDSEADEISVQYKQSLVVLQTDIGSTNSKNFLKSLLECPNEEIFKTSFVQDLLTDKWNRVRWILYLQGIKRRRSFAF